MCRRIRVFPTRRSSDLDKSIPHLDLKNVKCPREVKELIHKHVEEAKDKRRMRTTELVGGEGGGEDFHDSADLDDEELD